MLSGCLNFIIFSKKTPTICLSTAVSIIPHDFLGLPLNRKLPRL